MEYLTEVVDFLHERGIWLYETTFFKIDENKISALKTIYTSFSIALLSRELLFIYKFRPERPV